MASSAFCWESRSASEGCRRLESGPSAAVLLLRQLLSQMDVPTRQAYTMALVAPDERKAAPSVTSLARSAGSAASPVISGALLSRTLLTLGLSFVVAGALKSLYDVSLWRIFRRVPVVERTTLRAACDE